MIRVVIACLAGQHRKKEGMKRFFSKGGYMTWGNKVRYKYIACTQSSLKWKFHRDEE